MKRRLFRILPALAITLGVLTGPIMSATDRYDRSGCTVGYEGQGPTIHLIFPADSMFEGGEFILQTLDSRNIKGSFFFTGNFLRDTTNHAIVKRIIDSGHYVGPHSDRHILLADWGEDRAPLVSPDSALADMRNNYAELSRFGISQTTSPTIVPPYEWYAPVHIRAYREAGLQPVSPSPGILTFYDYTTPDMPDYHTADTLWRQLMDREHSHGLAGTIIILHPGTQDIRTDKFYHRLPEIIDTLTERGYKFLRY